MTPIDQTKTLDQGLRGNCLAASLASLFDLELAAVPEFEELPPGAWKVELDRWVASLGKNLIKKTPGEYVPGEHYIAVGLSSRGNRHATVGLNGQIVHDPDLRRLGLAEIQYLFVPGSVAADLA